MTFSEVQALLKAGFTADEIRSFSADPQVNNPQIPQLSPQEETVPEPDPVPDEKPEETAPETPGYEELNSKFTQLNEAVTKLIKTIQVSNVHRNTIDTAPVGTDINKQVDEIMASIIRPERSAIGA